MNTKLAHKPKHNVWNLSFSGMTNGELMALYNSLVIGAYAGHSFLSGEILNSLKSALKLTPELFPKITSCEEELKTKVLITPKVLITSKDE